MKIKCVITDDEPVARKGIQGYVEKVSFLELTGVCADATALNTLLKEHEVDLLFLDIEMPYMNGIELLQSLQHPPKVIFTTAYEKYALKGYDLEVIDYLLKPISFERFLKAANRAYEILFSRADKTAAYIFVKSDEKLVKVFYDDICYIESMENYVSIYTSQQRYIVHTTLKSTMENLPGTDFIQVHKSFVVHLQKITGIDGNMLELGKFNVMVSRSMRESVMEKIIQNRLLKK